MAARVVVEGGDEAVSAQHLVHTCALHADASPVHEAHLAQAERMRFLEIGIDHVGDVAWRERVQIEFRTDRNDVRISQGRSPKAEGRLTKAD